MNEWRRCVKKEILPFVDNMDGSWGDYAKWNKSDRERQILYDLSYMWNLNKNKKAKLIDREQIGGYQRWGIEGGQNG